MPSKKCCLGLAAFFYIGTLIFAIVMLAIYLQDYSTNSDEQADLISNYSNWLCSNLCGSYYPTPSASDFCCDVAFTGCRLRSICRDEYKNRLDDDLSEDVKYILIFGSATTLMLYAAFKIVASVCRRRRSNRQIYYIRQSNHSYNQNQDIRQEPEGQVQPQPEQPEEQANVYEGINGLRQSFVCKDKQNNCAICMDALNVDKVIILTCMHMFHSQCIRAWISKDNSCPVCRTPN